MPSRLWSVVLLVVAGCAASRPAASPGAEAWMRVWAGADAAAASLDGRVPEACDGTFGTWFAGFGVRGLACVAAEVEAPSALLAGAPGAVFRSGPHAVSPAGVELDLQSRRAFGHYDPAFVRWLAAAAIPDGEAAVALTRAVYERRLARLARIYWLTRQDLVAGGFPRTTPVGPLKDYAAFLDGGPLPASAAFEGGFSVFAFTERSERLLPQVELTIANDWEAKYEANTAYGFWLRRRADGTEALWHDALRTLLGRYDAAWLAAHGS